MQANTVFSVLHLTNDRLNCSGLLSQLSLCLAGSIIWGYTRHLSLSVRRKLTVNVFTQRLQTFFFYFCHVFTFVTFLSFGERFFFIYAASHRPATRAHPAERSRHVVISRDGRKLITVLRFALCCHSNATRAPIANPPNSAQLGAASTTPPSYIRVRAVVWAYGHGQTHRQIDTCRQTRVTTIHFASSTTHSKCNELHAGAGQTEDRQTKDDMVQSVMQLHPPRRCKRHRCRHVVQCCSYGLGLSYQKYDNQEVISLHVTGPLTGSATRQHGWEVMHSTSAIHLYQKASRFIWPEGYTSQCRQHVQVVLLCVHVGCDLSASHLVVVRSRCTADDRWDHIM